MTIVNDMIRDYKMYSVMAKCEIKSTSANSELGLMYNFKKSIRFTVPLSLNVGT